MTDTATSLDDYTDDMPADAPVELAPHQKLRAGMDAAETPKPKLAEMIETLKDCAYEIERGQMHLLDTGDRAEPFAPALRRAAILRATQVLLERIEPHQAVVGKLLRGARR